METPNYKFTIGADPEFFVIDKKTSKPVPSCRKFGGEKRAPMFLSPDGGFLEDGATVEFNVTPSATLKECRKKIEGLLLVFLNKFPDYTLSRYSAAEFSEGDLKQYPEACEIGCSPDLFAYGLRVAPEIKQFGNMRFAGGHIHLGIDPWPEGLEKKIVVQLFDFLLMLPVAQRWANEHRYKFYGHPGLYRETNYGVEYRSPDNWWCNPETIAHASPENRNFLINVIQNFDDSMSSLRTVLLADGHGARVNKELRLVIADSGLVPRMETINKSKMDIRHYGGEYLSYRNYLDNMVEVRKTGIDPPRPKKKFVPNW